MAPTSRQHKRHSILGTFSLIAGIVSSIVSCLAIVALLGLIAIHLGRVSPSDLQTTLGELCGLGNGVLAFGGLAAGVIGFFEKERDRVPNILGIILCVFSLIILGAVFLLGSIAGPDPALPNL
jgi:hypothetical protein